MTNTSGFRRPLVLGHRGAPAVATENTLAAFAAARTAGADGVELDVRRTADGELVVHHDPRIGESGPVIVEKPWSELASGFPELPTLDAALAACDGLIVNVEVKNWPTEPDFDPAQSVAAAVAAKVARRPGIIVSSFNLYALEVVRGYDVTIATGLLGARIPPDGIATWIADARARGFGGVHPEADMVDAGFVAAARAAGLAVRVWTVDDPAQARGLAALGVDAIITNDPTTILTALGASAQGTMTSRESGS